MGRVSGQSRADNAAILLAGNGEPADEVEERTGAAQEGEHDEPDPHEHRVDLEVGAEPPGHAGDHPVGGAALQRGPLGHTVVDRARVLASLGARIHGVRGARLDGVRVARLDGRVLGARIGGRVLGARLDGVLVGHGSIVWPRDGPSNGGCP